MAKPVTLQEFLVREESKKGSKYPLVEGTFTTMTKKATFLCAIHGEFQKTPSEYLRTNGCPICYGKGMNKHRAKIKHKDLISRLDYDPISGYFTWIKNTRNHKLIGKIAGCVDKSKGYRELRIDGVKYLAHRLAWFYMTGEFPDLPIDHEDRNRDNNAWDNLNPKTEQGNSRNRGGVKGYYWHKRDKQYIAKITVDYQSIYLGSYDNKEDAIRARALGVKRYWG